MNAGIFAMGQSVCLADIHWVYGFRSILLATEFSKLCSASFRLITMSITSLQLADIFSVKDKVCICILPSHYKRLILCILGCRGYWWRIWPW